MFMRHLLSIEMMKKSGLVPGFFKIHNHYLV